MITFEKDIKAGRIKPDMNFHQKIWALCARIPKGKVSTYGQLAGALDSKGARAVGQAMNRNPYAPVVPCHRVVGSDGSLVGFASGLARKRRMLKEEGVTLVKGKVDKSFFHAV